MSMEEVVDMALLDEEVKKHVMENHSELAGKTPEEMKVMVAGMVTEEVAGAMPGAM